MNTYTKLFTVVAASLMFSIAWADATPEDCAQTTAMFRSTGGNVADMIDKAYGYAVLPVIGKGGFVVGGGGGSGCVYAGGKQTGTVKMGQLSIGFQAGGQAFSQIILFENKAAFDLFTDGQFEFGADASAVALTAGAQAQAGTKGAGVSAGGSDQRSGGQAASYARGMAVFTVAKGGLMYEASIGGQKFDYAPL